MFFVFLLLWVELVSIVTVFLLLALLSSPLLVDL